MAIEKVIDIKIQGNADEAVGSLRSQLRAAQAEVAELSAKFGATSQEAINAAKRAGQLKDQIGDAKALTDAFNPDAKFKSLSASLAGVAGGFAVVQGSMALLGTESEEVEKTLLKVQGAMALSQGLQTIGESVDSFKQLGAVVKSYTIVQRISTAAQAVFNAVMAANPIGAVVVAVTALIAAGYALVKMFQASSEETKRSEAAHKALGKELKTQVEAQKNATIEADLSRDAQLKMAKASGKSADEIRKLSVELANQEVAQKIANAQTLRAIAIEAIRVANLEDASESQKTLAKNALKEFNDANEAAKTALINRRKLLIDNRAAELQEQTDATRKANDKANEAADKKSEKEKEKRKKEREDYLKDAEELESLKAKLEQNRLDKEAEVKKKADEIQQGLQDNALTPAQRLQKKYDEERAILEAAHQSTLLLDAKFYTDKKALEAADTANKQKNAETQEQIEKRKQQAREQYLAAGANTLKQAASLLGEATGAGKALAIAATTIDTYQSATAAYKSLAGIPVVGPALGGIAAGVAVAAGLANVKKILAVKVPGGGGGGGNVPSGGGAPSAPQFNVVGNSGVNQLADVMNTQQQTPVKAYVVPSDVTTGQSLDRNIIRNASLG
jgi:chemotaxis protein histidine kinase CheA